MKLDLVNWVNADEKFKIYEEIYNSLKSLNNEKSRDFAKQYADEVFRKYSGPRLLEEFDVEDLPLLEKCVELYREADDKAGFISAEENLAEYWRQQGDFTKELSLREEILLLCKEFYGIRNWFAFRNKLELLADMERYDDAQKCWEDYRVDLEPYLHISETDTDNVELVQGVI